MPGPTLRLGPLLRLPLRYPLGMAINDWDFAVNLKSRRSSRRRDNLVRSLGSRHISTGKEEFPFEYRPPFRAQAVTNIWDRHAKRPAATAK